MRSAADLCFHNEQLPRPARKATYRRAGGWPRRKGPLDAPMTKTDPSKDLPHYCNNRCVTLLFHMLQRTLPAGFVATCLPIKTEKLPSGSQWLHEIKHDGFRVIARKKGAQVRLYSRPGNDLTHRFPLIVETLARLRSRSCIIDGEAVACDDNGVASFNLVRHQRANEHIFLYAFDLIELNGDDCGAIHLRSASHARLYRSQGQPRHPVQ